MIRTWSRHGSAATSIAALTTRAILARAGSRGRRQREPVDARGTVLAVGVHHLAHALGVDRRPLRAAAVDLHSTGAGHREAVVGADEHDDGVGVVVLDLVGRELAPVDEQRRSRCRCRCAGPGSRGLPSGASACARSWSSGSDIESPVTSNVWSRCFGGRGAPSWLGSNESGVTGGIPAAGARGDPGAEPAGTVQRRVRREKRGQSVGRRSHGQLIGDPCCGPADGEHRVAADPGVHLIACLADRGTRADDQDRGHDRAPR